MSGDITTRKKRKSAAGRKKEDDILLEPKNPPIDKRKKPQIIVDDLPAPKERNLFSKLCYAFIIFVLLTSRYSERRHLKYFENYFYILR